MSTQLRSTLTRWKPYDANHCIALSRFLSIRDEYLQHTYLGADLDFGLNRHHAHDFRGLCAPAHQADNAHPPLLP